ncbi:MAG: transcriptional repressor [Trueperaceae bacterium]|jgi:Fur family ferric uptake transcriptional regulator|nr:transcriptional repressor [Trueperaceae bacterium]HRQ10501.1 transcriptional repressor [Trueperaceae bacterium]
MRRTPQQHAVLDALEAADGPLTARELHERARARLPSLGLATVYRHLSRLEQGGRVVAVHLAQDAVRYEPAGRGHHHHFRCVRCSAVLELDGACPVAMLEGATLPGGLTVLGHELTLFGLCPACSGAATSATAVAAAGATPNADAASAAGTLAGVVAADSAGTL